MILKNIASQGIYLYAVDTGASPVAGKTGDQSNITGKISIDGGAETSFGTTNPTSIGGGIYWQPLSQAETNGNHIALRWTSSTTNIVIDPVIVFTSGVNLPAVAYGGNGGVGTVDGNGRVDVGKILGTASQGAAGYVGIDWAKVTNPTTTLNLSGTTINTGQIVATVSGNVNGNVAGDVAGSLGGNIIGNVNGTVGSVLGAVTVGTNNDKTGYTVSTVSDKTGYRLSQAGLADFLITDTAKTYADAVSGAVAHEIVANVSGGGGGGGLTQADVRAAVGLGSANLDTQLGAIAGYIDTEVAAIKSKTDNLPSDPADASDITAAFSTVNSTLATIAGYIDTEVAAIKAKTDNLPADPASAATLASSFSTVNSTLATIAGYVDTEVAAIKAKTDQLTFSTSNRVDAQLFGAQANTITASALATDAVAEIVTGVLTDTSNNTTNGSPGKILAQLGGSFTTQSSSVFSTNSLANAPSGGGGGGSVTLHTGTAQDGSNTTITLDSGADDNDNFYKGASIRINGGTGDGQNARVITSYSGTTKVATVAPQWTINPDDTSDFVIEPQAGADVELVQGSVPTPLSSFDVTSIAGDEKAATLLALMAKASTSVVVSDSSPTTTGFVVAAANGDTLGTTDGWYSQTGATLYFTSGNLRGEGLPITGWDAANRRVSFSTAFPAAPDNGSSALIVGRSSTTA